MRLLIFSVEDYLGIARLPKALQHAGFQVASLSAEGTYLAKTRFLDKRFTTDLAHGIQKVVKDYVEAIKDWEPFMVIPGDDKGFRLMQRIEQVSSNGALKSMPAHVIEVLRRSLGDTAHLDEVINKGKFQAAAARIGVRVPAQERIHNVNEALAFAHKHGYPVVLKKDYSVSGQGVAICRDEKALVRALHDWMHGPIKRLTKNLLRGLLESSLDSALRDSRAELNIQQYVPGPIGMYATVAIQGRQLGGIAFNKERTYPDDTGPSSVVRSFENAEVTEAVSALMQYFRLTGFISFDFVIHKDTQRVYMLECNPRPTPVMHLGSRFGSDFCETLYKELHGRAVIPGVFREELVALFPQEFLRDPNSSFIKGCYHDVPWDDPELLEGYLKHANASLQELQKLAQGD